MGGDEAEDPAAADAGSDIDLLEDEDEAIGDRIMEVGAPASFLKKSCNWLTAFAVMHWCHKADTMTNTWVICCQISQSTLKLLWR